MLNNKILIGAGVFIILIIGVVLFFSLDGEDELIVEDVWEDDWEDDWEATVTEPEEAWTDEGWESSIIKDGFHSFGDFNIAIDSKGKLHMIYDGLEGNNNVKYLYQTEGGYEKETIIEQTFGGLRSTYPDIAIGDDGVHVVYFGDEGGKEKFIYAFRDNGEWQTETDFARTGIPRNGSPSIALDDDGFVHIVYWRLVMRAGDSDLDYLTNKNKEWEKKGSESEGGTRETLFLTVDSRGNPHISYITREDHERIWSSKLFYSTIERSQWKLEEIEESAFRPKGGGVLVDSDGSPRIFYSKTVEDEYGNINVLTKAVLKDGEWVVDFIETERELRDWGSAVMDKDDQAHIAYIYYGYEGRYRWSGISYMHEQDGSWQEKVIKDTAKLEGDQEKRIDSVDLAISNDGKAQVVYLLKDISGDDDVYTLVHLREK